MKTKSDDKQINVIEVKRGFATIAIVGDSPLILNRLSEKAKRELLMPKGRKTTADKATSLKHDPLAEFRASPYTLPDDTAPTLLALPSTAIKRAMAKAALDMPGAKKAEIGRLTWIEGDYTPVFGVPFLKMDVTRSADMNHTPDVRTRAALKEWAAIVTIQYVSPNLNDTAVINLLAAAGMMVGLGDWRQEKGAGSYGRFHLVGKDDAELTAIMKEGGRGAQIQGMNEADTYDAETEELYLWFRDEVVKRGKQGMVKKEEAA